MTYYILQQCDESRETFQGKKSMACFSIVSLLCICMHASTQQNSVFIHICTVSTAQQHTWDM